MGLDPRFDLPLLDERAIQPEGSQNQPLLFNIYYQVIVGFLRLYCVFIGLRYVIEGGTSASRHYVMDAIYQEMLVVVVVSAENGADPVSLEDGAKYLSNFLGKTYSIFNKGMRRMVEEDDYVGIILMAFEVVLKPFELVGRGEIGLIAI